MFPLAGPQIPDSPEALADALTRGLADRGITAREVSARGVWPTLDLLRMDLTGSKLSRDDLAKVNGESHGSLTAARFHLSAEPAELSGVPAHVDLQANDAVLSFAPAENGASVLLIKSVARGTLTAEVALADIERLLLSFASKAAGEHGVDVKNVKISLSSRGPRAVSFKADVTAKMFVATATVALSGDVDLDDQLNARISNLGFSGDGMVASLAGGFIRPKLAALEGRSFPLASLSLGKLTLRDVQLQAGETLRLSAQFGS